MEEWRSQIKNDEATQRFSKIRRSLPLLHGDTGRRWCSQSPEAWTDRQRKLEPWGELPKGDLEPGRERLSSGPLPDSTGSRERKSEKYPGFSLPLLSVFDGASHCFNVPRAKEQESLWELSLEVWGWVWESASRLSLYLKWKGLWNQTVFNLV